MEENTNQVTETKAKKRPVKGLIAFIIILVLAVALTVFQIVNSALAPDPKPSAKFKKPQFNKNPLTWNFDSNKFSKVKEHKHSGNYIAKLCIQGVIENSNDSYNQEWILDTIEELSEDENNVGLILYLSTPGGGVYEADEVYLKLLEYKKQKPLYAYMGPLAASGGYYIACAADYIMANRNTLTGSIGVIAGQSVDLTGLMEKAGIKSTTIHAGANKNMGNYNEPLSQEQQDILQSIADECYEQFTDIVARERSLKKNDVLRLADGRIYTAKQAKENGLIDAIGSWDDVVNHMEAEQFNYDDVYVEEYKYEPEYNFYRMLRGAAEDFKKTAAAGTALPEAVENAVKQKTPYPAYYYDAGR